MAEASKENHSSATPGGPLLVFVLGAPCAGKSTLCINLAEHYNLDHFSIGTELRFLVSNNPTGHAARIKPLFTPSELAVFTTNVYAGTLGPSNQTPKYVKERIFPSDNSIDPSQTRILVDGFPRDIDRWQTFKETVKDKWRPDQRAMVILLKVTKDLARERYVNRGREGDEFETRFEAWNSKVRDIEESMRNDGLFVLNIVVDKDADAEDVAKVVEKSDFWRSHVSRS